MIILPHEGLGNRVRVMLAALQWSHDTGRPVRFIWIRENNLNCRFDKIFMPISNMFELPPVWRRGWHFLLRFKKVLERMGVRFFDDGDYKAFSCYMGGNDFSGLTIASSMSCFYAGKLPQFSDIFKLRPELEAQVSQISNKFSSNTIGIHIRRTDNAEAIKNSPVVIFYEKIEHEIERNDDCSFFLASDDAQVLTEMKQRYGNRIIVCDGILARDSESGIQHAVIELFALSRCKKIWGSYFSSFSELAAEIGQIPLEIVSVGK